MLPLPVCPPPASGELMTSWFARLAAANYCSQDELARHLCLSSAEVGDRSRARLLRDLPRIAFAGRISTRRARAMLLPSLSFREPALISAKPFQHCRVCVRLARFADFELRHWRFAWSTRCKACGAVLTPLEERHGEIPPGLLNLQFLSGARVLRWIHKHGTSAARRRLSRHLQIIGYNRGYRPGSSVLYRFEGSARIKALVSIHFEGLMSPSRDAIKSAVEMTPEQRLALRPPPVNMS